MAVRLRFHGGAGTVTGSCAEIEHPGGRLLVDCGMFQGNRTTRELNYAPFPFPPDRIDHLLLTHAHIDHSGLIPKLALAGFDGPIHATAPTLDLLGFMLPDSGAIQEGDVRRLNKRLRREGKQPVVPIYTRADAEDTLTLGRAHPLEEWFGVGRGAQARFWNAGHMLGSVSIELAIEAGGPRPLRLLFSGDLGPQEKAFHPPPDAPEGYDYVVCESTYGDRDRPEATVKARRETLRAEIVAALGRGGNLVIPSFAVERSQELLHDIGVLLAEKAIPQVPVFLDSPLASRVTGVFVKHAAALDDIDVDEAALFRHPSFRITEGVEESMAINRISGGAIIISASGMADAGRVKHHLRNNLWREDATVLFVGYQAPGTLGERLKSGVERARIHGRDVQVRATIRAIEGYSAHADQPELRNWILARRPIRAGLFLNHGDEEAREALRALLLEDGLNGADIFLPTLDDSYVLTAGAAPLREPATPRIDPERLRRDWADDYVGFTLRLAEALEAAPDAAAREALMGRLTHALDAAQ